MSLLSDMEAVASRVSVACDLFKHGYHDEHVTDVLRDGFKFCDVVKLAKKNDGTFSAQSIEASRFVDLVETQPRLAARIAEAETVRQEIEALINGDASKAEPVRDWFFDFAAIMPIAFGRPMGCIP